jgi:hypothetical protein
MRLLEKLKERLYQDDVRQFYEESTEITQAGDFLGRVNLGRAIVLGAIGVASTIGAYLAYDYWRRNRDSDGDGIKDIDEIEKYHTNPNSKDTDNDGLTDYQEIFIYHTNPLKPNPNVKHALDFGLEKYIEIVKPLDNDGIQDSNERQFVELMANSKKVLDVPTFINYLKEKASDGKITDEELKYSNNFASLVNRLYDEIYNLKNLYENNPKLKIEDPMKTIDYSSGLGTKLGF